MPLEIKELHIKATITDGDHPIGPKTTSPGMDARLTDEMIRICVEKVLDILKDKADR